MVTKIFIDNLRLNTPLNGLIVMLACTVVSQSEPDGVGAFMNRGCPSWGRCQDFRMLVKCCFGAS